MKAVNVKTLNGGGTGGQTDELLNLLRSRCGSWLLSVDLNLGDVEVRTGRAAILDLLKCLKDDQALAFNCLVSLTVVDYQDHDFIKRPEAARFEVVYHLMSLCKGYRLRVKVSVPEEDPEIESAVSLWPAANFLEREAWDMFGVVFKNHPDLRRVLMYEEFQGHALRKDYPLRGKQPRIALRHPETYNTSADMRRRPLGEQAEVRDGESSPEAQPE